MLKDVSRILLYPPTVENQYQKERKLIEVSLQFRVGSHQRSLLTPTRVCGKEGCHCGDGRPSPLTRFLPCLGLPSATGPVAVS